MRVLGTDIIVDIQHYENSLFGKEIYELFTNIRPMKIIETGTFVGKGSTHMIANFIQKLGLDSIFYSIEINPEFIEQAKENLGKLNSFVFLKNGLSIPKQMLPTFEELEKELEEYSEDKNLLVDHRKEDRVNLYMKETDFSYLSDDMLGECLEEFDFCPDFVLLDSGGHMGYREFKYLIDLLKGDCYIALDDIFHIKHHKSFLHILTDKHFLKTLVLNEGTGQCITKFIKV